MTVGSHGDLLQFGSLTGIESAFRIYLREINRVSQQSMCSRVAAGGIGRRVDTGYCGEYAMMRLAVAASLAERVQVRHTIGCYVVGTEPIEKYDQGTDARRVGVRLCLCPGDESR